MVFGLAMVRRLSVTLLNQGAYSIVISDRDFERPLVAVCCPIRVCNRRVPFVGTHLPKDTPRCPSAREAESR